MPEPTSLTDTPICSLVCLGNLCIDDVVQPDGVERPGSMGGDALYGVLAARLFQPQAQLVAPVGADLPADILAGIGKAGLSKLGLIARPVPTLRNRIQYLTPDERIVTLLSSEQDFEVLSPHGVDIPEPFWNAKGFMILAMTLAAQQDLIATARARRGRAVVLALDPQEEYIAGNEGAILAMLRDVDLFMPSLGEVRALLGHSDPAAAARQFAARGPSMVVIKLGAEGCLVHDARHGADVRVAAQPVIAQDTTGAGDAFCSAFMACHIEDPADLRRSAAAGSVAAAIAVSGFGPAALFDAIPSQAQALRDTWLAETS